MSSWTPTTYKTRNWSEYNQSLTLRGLLSIWFDPEMAWEAEASGRRGRQQSYSDAAIQACLPLKVLFGLPLRQTTGFVDSLLNRVGLDWSVPDFSTLCRRQRTLSVAMPLYRRERMPGCGNLIRQEHARATKPCDPQSIWAVPCGET